ncbi:MAG: hypothetical protein V1820_01300 [archaeon]
MATGNPSEQAPPQIEKRDGFPFEGDLVLCTVTTVYPTSAFARLEEFHNLEGMIPIGEISSSWVKNIRSIVKEDKSIVCLVMAVNLEKRHITLSLKRVSEVDKKQKFEQVKRAKKTSKMLEIARRKITVDGELLERIEKEFTEVYFAFEAGARLGAGALAERGFSPEVSKVFEETGKDNITFQDVELKASVELSSFAEDGVAAVKRVLAIAGKAGAQVSYISAPKYRISLTAKDYKTAERQLRGIAEGMAKAAKKEGTRFDFALIKDGNKEEEVKV